MMEHYGEWEVMQYDDKWIIGRIVRDIFKHEHIEYLGEPIEDMMDAHLKLHELHKYIRDTEH